MIESKLFRGFLFLLLTLLFSTQFCSNENDQLARRHDPARDPFTDLNVAIDLARQSDKRILLEVGGEWCKWCRYLDEFLNEHAEINNYLNDQFVLVKVNYSPENENTEFLSRYPKISGYPHIYVLSANGDFLHSQGTAELESGQSYDPVKMIDFLDKWAESGYNE